MTPAGSVPADDSADRSQTVRRIALYGLIAFAILQPAVSLLGHPLDGRRWFQVIGAVALTGLVCWRLDRHNGSVTVPWLSLVGILALGIALFVLGGGDWLAMLAITAAVFGGHSQTLAPAVIGAAAGGVAGLGVAVANGYQSGLVAAATFVPPMASLFAYSASRRADALDKLKRTRAELARAAAADLASELAEAAAAGHDAIADIAGRLHLSPGTVRNHLSAAIQKLGARNRAEAAQIARQKGWL